MNTHADSTSQEAFDQLIKAPMDFFQRNREEGELDLVAWVRNELVAAGAKDRLSEAFDANRFVQDARMRNSHAQQYCLNRYFVMQFMSSREDTALLRYQLIYEIGTPEWMRIVKDSIIPNMINLDLPVPV